MHWNSYRDIAPQVRLNDTESGGAKEILCGRLLDTREENGMQRDRPKRPTRPSEAFKKATVSTPASVMGTSAKD